jgi:hypothetical protein
MYEMRYRIREKDSREETGEVVIPVQMMLPWIGCYSSLSACLFRGRVRKRGVGMIEEQTGERVMEQYLPRIRPKSMALTAGKAWYQPCGLPIESLDDAGGEG